MSKTIVIVCFIVTLLAFSNADGQVFPTETNSEKLGRAALQQKVPDQKHEMLNTLVSKTWLVFRDPGSGSNPFAGFGGATSDPPRDINHIDLVWKFGYGKDADENKRVILCADHIAHRVFANIAFTPMEDDILNTVRGKQQQSFNLSTPSQFETTYDSFHVGSTFSLRTFQIDQLQNDKTIKVGKKEYSFAAGTKYVTIKADDIVGQKSNVMSDEGSDHTWTIRIFPLENGNWVGQLDDVDRSDERLDKLEQYNRDLVNGTNHVHSITLIPMKKNVGVSTKRGNQNKEDVW